MADVPNFWPLELNYACTMQAHASGHGRVCLFPLREYWACSHSAAVSISLTPREFKGSLSANLAERATFKFGRKGKL